MTGAAPSWGPAAEGHGVDPTGAPAPAPAPAPATALAPASAWAEPLRSAPWHAGLVRGPARVALLCALCWVVATGLSLVCVLVSIAVTGFRAAAGGVGGPGGDVMGAAVLLVYVPVVWLAAIVPVVLVGWPAGLVVAWLLRRRPREVEHVLAFAAVGAMLAALLVRPSVTGGWPDALLVGAVVASLGAAGAGGGRWWAGAVLRRRAARGALAHRPGIAPPPPWW